MERAGYKQSATILVVDDSDDLRDLLVMQLQTLGYQTAEASNGLEAIEVAKQTTPALILMDINMPLLDGLEATRVIRQTAPLFNIPIVAFSAYISVANRERAVSAGCNGYVDKTDCVVHLDDIIRRFAPLNDVPRTHTKSSDS